MNADRRDTVHIAIAAAAVLALYAIHFAWGIH